MRTLTLHTADELVERWKRRAFDLDHPSHPNQAAAQAYRVCATELMAIIAASMELEAAHHGDPEPAFPSDPVVGDLYGDLETMRGYVYTGSAWLHDPTMTPAMVQALAVLVFSDGADPNALLDWSQGNRP